MTTENMVRELRNIADKHKKDFVGFGEIRWSDLCTDVANRLEEQAKEIAYLTNANGQKQITDSILDDNGTLRIFGQKAARNLLGFSDRNVPRRKRKEIPLTIITHDDGSIEVEFPDLIL